MKKEIIEAAQKGEAWALTELYNNTYNSIYYNVRVIIRDQNEAYDVIQDSYIKAFSSLDQLKDPDNFNAWLKKISTNKAKDYLKKRKLINFSDMEDENRDLELEFEDERIEFNPSIAADKKETKRLLWEIIDSLTEEQRLVIDMFYFQELSIKEIAEFVGCNENTIKSRLNYGRKNIEAKVIELEKKGTKLYGLAPLPFLLFLLRSAEAQAAEVPASTILESIINSSRRLKSASMGTSIGKGITGGTTKTISTKVAAGILAGLVAVGGITGYVVANNNNNIQAAAENEDAETNENESLSKEMEEQINSGIYIQDNNFYMRVNIEKLNDTTANVIIQDTYNGGSIVWEGEAAVDSEEKVLATIVENEMLFDLEEEEKTIKITLLNDDTIQVEASEKLQTLYNTTIEGTYEQAKNIIEIEQPLYLQETNIIDSEQIRSVEYYGENYIVSITSIVDSPASFDEMATIPAEYQRVICRVKISYTDTLEEQMPNTIFYYSEEEGAYRSTIYPVAFNFDKNDLNLELLEYENPGDDNMSGTYNGIVDAKVNLNTYTDSFEEIDLKKYNGLSCYDMDGNLRYELGTSDGGLTLLCKFQMTADQGEFGLWEDHLYKINYDSNSILSVVCKEEDNTEKDITYKFNDMRFIFLGDIVLLEVEANYRFAAGGSTSFLDTGIYLLENN